VHLLNSPVQGGKENLQSRSHACLRLSGSQVVPLCQMELCSAVSGHSMFTYFTIYNADVVLSTDNQGPRCQFEASEFLYIHRLQARASGHVKETSSRSRPRVAFRTVLKAMVAKPKEHSQIGQKTHFRKRQKLLWSSSETPFPDRWHLAWRLLRLRVARQSSIVKQTQEFVGDFES
jgi:hypothetical protein